MIAIARHVIDMDYKQAPPLSMSCFRIMMSLLLMVVGWRVEHAFMLYGAQGYVAQHIATYVAVLCSRRVIF
jgi:hypothetical protein